MTRPLDARLLRQLSLYTGAGITSFIAEYGLFLLLFYKGGLAAGVANALAFLVGLGVNFALNRQVVFRGSARKVHKQLVAYSCLAGFNLLVTSFAIQVLVASGIPGYLAKLCLLFVTALWNFALYRKIIFRLSES